MWIGADIRNREQSLVAFRTAVTGIAILLEQWRTALCLFIVDLKWIFRRRDFFADIGLVFHIGKNEIAMLAVHWSTEPEGREQISRDRCFRISVPVHPRPFPDI